MAAKRKSATRGAARLPRARRGRAPGSEKTGLARYYELYLALSNSLRDGTYAAGDLSEPTTDHDQPPFVIGSEPCLCIIASEGMRLRGLLGFAQRMIGQ